MDVGVVMSSGWHVELRPGVDFSENPSVRSDHSGENNTVDAIDTAPLTRRIDLW